MPTLEKAGPGADCTAVLRLFQDSFACMESGIELTENHRTFAAMGFVKSGERAHAGYGRPTSVTMHQQVDGA